MSEILKFGFTQKEIFFFLPIKNIPGKLRAITLQKI